MPGLRHPGVRGGAAGAVALGETELDHQDRPRHRIGSTPPNLIPYI
jgi:hypothetical protein